MALSKTALKRVINSVPEPDGDDVGKWVVGVCRAIEAEVRKQDTELIRQLVEALERANKHHFTTSLPLVIAHYGSTIKCANEGSIVWRDLIPSAITAGRARLEGKP